MEVSISVSNPVLLGYLAVIPVYWATSVLNYSFLSDGDVQIALAHAILWPLDITARILRTVVELIKLWKE
jgi:hypothetical protein